LGLEYNCRAAEIKDDIYENLERGFLGLKKKLMQERFTQRDHVSTLVTQVSFKFTR